MPVFSSLRAPTVVCARGLLKATTRSPQLTAPVRCMGGNSMVIKPSSFLWNRMKDDVHFYLMLGIIPVGLIVLYSNLVIGPAELRDTPEGYVPHDYEYIKHPISRYMQKHFYPSYEKTYERTLYYMWLDYEKIKARRKTQRVQELSKQRQDEQNWYFVPMADDMADREMRGCEIKQTNKISNI